MNSGFVNGGFGERENLATLDKVDKLRELIGSRVSLPQLFVVGDQSSSKSSVLKGITGFACPRDAELCTRYATQITCRREDFESVTVAIVPHEDTNQDEVARLNRFSRTWNTSVDMDKVKLGEVFRDVNQELAISSGRRGPVELNPGNAFSQHLLKVEISSPNQEHFTVIDVPGIFRTETLGESTRRSHPSQKPKPERNPSDDPAFWAGLTTESDIVLIRNMVMTNMKDFRTMYVTSRISSCNPVMRSLIQTEKT
ncbi:hypothetical protein MCOR16_010603 [Pyricularia oryzae]|nr:hypothetical protein MCOR16_010603 [Pyricularia oryzae]